MGLLLLIASIVFIVFIIAGNAYAVWWTKNLIINRHKDIEEILETKRPPARWPASGFPPSKGSIARLKRLLRYVQNTRLMADEDTREEIRACLDEILKTWQIEKVR